MTEVLLRLGAKGGGTRCLIRRKIEALGLDTSHFQHVRTGRPRVRGSFTCQSCGREVLLGAGDVPKVFCSDSCLAQGRSRPRDPEVRERIRQGQLSNWAQNRDSRLESMAAAQGTRTEAARRASQEPTLRAKRSENAKRRWAEDPSAVAKFQAAAVTNRRRRALEETCPRRPHVPLFAKQGLVMVRSKWERDFGLWLDLQGLEWGYEPVRVVVDGRPYTPDFWVCSPFGPCYVEVHRVATAPAGDTKLTKMASARPKLAGPLILVAEEELRGIRKALRAV